MAFQRNNLPPAGKDDDAKYALILSKLIRTIDKYRSRYPELPRLLEFIESLGLNGLHLNPQVDKLAIVADHMADVAGSSYVIRHIHHHFSSDIRNLQEGSGLNGHMDLYLETGELETSAS